MDGKILIVATTASIDGQNYSRAQEFVRQHSSRLGTRLRINPVSEIDGSGAKFSVLPLDERGIRHLE